MVVSTPSSVISSSFWLAVARPIMPRLTGLAAAEPAATAALTPPEAAASAIAGAPSSPMPTPTCRMLSSIDMPVS